jgi:hypothetical protein
LSEILIRTCWPLLIYFEGFDQRVHFSGTLFVKQAQRKSADFRLTSRRKPRRMNEIWRNDASEVASVGELSTGELAPEGVGNFSAKRFEVLKLRKNAYQRVHQAPLEKIKQRLIYQI